MSGPRVLVALLVYNGRPFVPRAIASAARMPGAEAVAAGAGAVTTDVVVLDDASPEPGWSEELEAISRRFGVGYYRSPRNLGIPRNMNLGLLLGEEGGYDGVILLNSDVVVPAGLAGALWSAAQADPGAASVTPWSNNASIFSLENADADTELTDVSAVDDTASVLHSEFGTETVPLPTGHGFCLYVPRPALRDIGVMDPVFGRGYCEEVDWCQRAVSQGWKNVLALGTFVYHMGGATSRVSGLLAAGEQTVHVHEDLIDLRHPKYRASLAAFTAADPLRFHRSRATSALLRALAARHGYVVEATWLHRRPPEGQDRRVRVHITPDGLGPLVTLTGQGWCHELQIGADGILSGIADFLGCAAHEVRIHDRGPLADRLATEAASAGLTVRALARYPERV